MPKKSLRAPRKMKDVAMVVGRTDDNEGYQILRRRAADSPVEFGTLRPLKHGHPIDEQSELVELKPRTDVPFVFDVKSAPVVPGTARKRLTDDGPAQVASDEYRRGWDAIWGAGPRRALNKLN